ncbi:Bug family tripartite tricarboxylate transporter substrate binding protein [Plastoroseomonas hellenica]|uniref:Bug family tripartite tricarboxylate transporter substrate binding protein n=1 Tax=Plastoroseomonas hellenica TaxID=2687306 RepID=UPI001BA79BEA|nr:tripartite tricarboxylate transporter substrate binding protein [Plastoroseomonas hellenica]MBR0643121.1 tripartite tricarboxylate transporter substrate binding protein [Plastoroseomonas hellenica]
MAKTSRRPLLGGLAGLLASPGLARPALAQGSAAARPVTIIVPFAPGGSTDVVSRLMAERMTASLGQPVQVENRPGGNTIVGAEYVARARPDGQTLLMAAGTTLTINPVIQPNLPYAVEDFAPVMLATTFPFGIITRLEGGPVDVPAWVAAARARPGQMTYGTNGPTTLTNVAMLMVLERLGITMQDVTYRGDSVQLSAFLAGDIDMLIVAGGTAQPVHRNRQGRMIAWTSGRRVESTPEVPSIAEFAPGLEVLSWFGLLAPARTPAELVQRLNAAANQALQDPRLRERLVTEGQFLAGGTPQEFSEFLRRSDAQWRPILSRLNVPRN